MNTLNLELLKKAVDGDFAAARRITRLEPQGGKVFPPTYEGGEYADEQRLVRVKDAEGKEKIEAIETVLLDSVQSQANRLELALLRAYDGRRVRIPMLQVDFAAGTTDPILQEVGRITALEAPHRLCDAIFRDSIHEGRAFREVGAGASLNSAKSANATPVFALCPTALLFGFWDSTGPRGGLGAKVQRALVSEIVGYQGSQKIVGKRPSSRIDPLEIIKDLEIYKKEGGGWTFEVAEAAKNKNGEPEKTKASEINHGNIVPSFRHEDKNTKKSVLNHGGVSLDYAIQNTVLSLAALRRLRFPLNGTVSPQVDSAARVVLAALGLAAICLLDEDGYDLRSRCLLDGKPGVFEFVGRGVTSEFDLDANAATQLLAEAASAAKVLGLPWSEEPLTLQPSADLARLVSESRRRSMVSESAGS
ncbi:MAG TPA: type I-U CRISPR-associated RAMP protein Csb1/Cas7u [Bryobacteraceae bacterium]|jgi:CRISPR-associated protein Csb1|nr:type I-U CRISPR-associated RAMP protein Csb1/Cas7u [Bryobacteraceae bacterium]